MKKNLICLMLVLALSISLTPTIFAAPAGWTEVKTGAELQKALADTTTTQIIFGANIDAPGTGLSINNKKASVVIDGNGYMLTDYKESLTTSNVYVSAGGILKSVTIQNMFVSGRNTYGSFTSNTNTEFIFKNVKYSGPRLVYVYLGTVRIIDCDLANTPVGSSCPELAFATNFFLEGNVNLVRNAPKISGYLFSSPQSTVSSMTIKAGSNVRADVDQGNNDGYAESGFYHVLSFRHDLSFEENSKFEYNGTSEFYRGYPIQNLTVGKNAQVYITSNKSFAKTCGLAAIYNKMDVNEGAVFDVRAFGNTILDANHFNNYPVIHLTDKCLATFNNPKLVFIYNSSTNSSGNFNSLAIAAQYNSAVNVYTGTFNFINVRSIEYWHLNTNPPNNLPTPTKDFRNSDSSAFTASMTTRDIQANAEGARKVEITSSVAMGYRGATPFDITNTDLRSINVFRINGSSAVVEPKVLTGEAVNATENSAVINNNTYSNITGTINFVAVQYSTDLSMASAVTVNGTIGSPYSVNLTGLQPNTTYYYRAVVNTASGLIAGEVKSFKTPVQQSSVITGDAVNILSNSAIINNNTYSGITSTISFVAVQYSTSSTMTSATVVQGSTIGSPYSVNLTGLQPNTTYYYRAGVNTASGLITGEVKSFKTPAQQAVVTTGDVTDILPNAATITNNAYTGITGTISFVAVQYSTRSAMTSPITVRATVIGSPYSVDLTGLQPNTTYYYRAGVNTSSGSVFGVVKSFTTPENALRTVTVNHYTEKTLGAGDYVFNRTEQFTASDGDVIISSSLEMYLGSKYMFSHASPVQLTVTSGSNVINMFYKMVRN